ncbi:MAG TPA: RNA methyltransferase [Vicinamibacterales bacterium]|jgi:tRNA G18 (ribose-2'-O)-methylase SpoU
MSVERVDGLDDPRLADYRLTTHPDLLRRAGIFVAEGRLVVSTLIARSMCRARSILLTDAALTALGHIAEAASPDLPVYVATPGTIERLAGFNVHRGCLAIGERPAAVSAHTWLANHPDTRRLVVLEQIANMDNMGGIFRNAAGFGIDAVVLGPHCCDPLYRKSIRVSMGTALWVPHAQADDWPGALREIRDRGFTVVALTPSPDAIDIGHFADTLHPDAKVAVLVGSEAEGLSIEALSAAGAAVRIPMAPGIDSLNAATATGIALHRLTALG